MKTACERTGYGPWDLIPNDVKNAAAMESVLQYRPCMDYKNGLITWARPTGKGEKVMSSLPDFLNDANATRDLKREFNQWVIIKCSRGVYVAIVPGTEAIAEAYGTSEGEAFTHASVLSRGACV